VSRVVRHEDCAYVLAIQEGNDGSETVYVGMAVPDHAHFRPLWLFRPRRIAQGGLARGVSWDTLAFTGPAPLTVMGPTINEVILHNVATVYILEPAIGASFDESHDAARTAAVASIPPVKTTTTETE
jgi:hypothetical protein